ncbi:hypothetical protein C5167_040837 [Papaver somniferum]|uniref:TFIIS central domain-containing protein n=1 Tax=Papaver somniferum TaxID=3469 RepID=A0A4Y7IJK8_PAPSO|nr:uncharacterized protein LOC113319482 [Papaver somniferum]RZC47891.1 hypothetical protein C5167_040837 [Papaver somniferum]
MSTSEMSSGKSYCNSFKNKKFSFDVGDPTFIAPDGVNEKPKIAIIKHITEDSDGELMVMCQYLYRPEDVADRYGRMWQRYDDRELFYSFHQQEIPSVCLMHPCKVHFVPSVDKVPVRTQHPGFIVLRVYDHEEQVLWWITDRDFEKHKQVEIDHHLLKTQQLLGYDMEMKEEKAEYSLEEAEIMEEEVEENQPHIPVEEDAYDIDAILAKALTGDDVRDKCLGLLFEEINCTAYRASRDHHPKVVMSALVALEKACFRTRGENLAKYQQKMRQLRFNLKSTVELARRLIDGELEASAVVEMTAEELRKGCLSAEEKAAKEEPEEQHMDTADIPCPRCSEKKVGLHSNILRPGRAAGYQLECLKCGKTWFSPRL